MTNNLQDVVAMAPEETQFSSAASLRLKSIWFIQLRWWATAALAAASGFAWIVSGIPLPVGMILGVCVLLIISNLFYVLHNLRSRPGAVRPEIRMLKLQMIVDLFLLTAILNMTGGVENPFHYIYVIHVVIASMLFKGRETYSIAVLSIVLFDIEVLLERLQVLPHHHMPHANEVAHSIGYISMALLAFSSIMLFSAYMASTVMKHNRELKDELVDRQRRLAESGQAKLDFFRFVTHEIKSPIATAQSAIEAAVEVGRAEMTAPILDMLDRALKRLGQATNIVKDLADFTQGGVLHRPEFADLDLCAVTRRVVEDHAELIAARSLDLQLDIPDSPLIIRSDEGMLEKMIRNLVNNAVRYNRDRGLLRIGLSDGPDHVTLMVQDTGIGIPLDSREKVFEEFYRTQEARRVSNLGTGLGLPIVRKFVNELGGTITLASEPDVGTTFTINLRKT